MKKLLLMFTIVGMITTTFAQQGALTDKKETKQETKKETACCKKGSETKSCCKKGDTKTANCSDDKKKTCTKTEAKTCTKDVKTASTTPSSTK